ncbi:MAG: tetratricopeptide repeat protein [Bacteroidales bacterium]|nr:tetratricopeptide repeat protein [Bacteroidales bacterium]
MRKFLCISLALCCSIAVFGQKADLRRGNRQFKKKDYAAADISYRKALMLDTASVAAHYNLANNLYRQENLDEAARQLDAVQLTAGEEKFAADYYFNRGDIAIAQEDWQTAVNMFKESLRRRPEDLEAKENYLYARNKLMEQQQNQNQQNQDQNQEQQNQDQNQDQNQEQQNQDQNQDQQQNQQDQQNQQQQQQQQQDQQAQLNPQQAQQLLQAIQDKEKQTQEKVDEKKAQALKSRQKEKNW